jgi:hypothetical protein
MGGTREGEAQRSFRQIDPPGHLRPAVPDQRIHRRLRERIAPFVSVSDRGWLHPPAPDPFRAQPAAGAACSATGFQSGQRRAAGPISKNKRKGKRVGRDVQLPVAFGRAWNAGAPRPLEAAYLLWPRWGLVPNPGPLCAPHRQIRDTRYDRPVAARIAHTGRTASLRGPASARRGARCAADEAWNPVDRRLGDPLWPGSLAANIANASKSSGARLSLCGSSIRYPIVRGRTVGTPWCR